MVWGRLTGSTAACDWVSEMTRLKCGSWADARLLHYKYVKLLAPDQNDTLRGFLCTNRVSTNFQYKKGPVQRTPHSKEALSSQIWPDAQLLCQPGNAFVSWNFRILCTNWTQPHHSQDGGLRPEGHTESVGCHARNTVGVQTTGASSQVNEGTGPDEHFLPLCSSLSPCF